MFELWPLFLFVFLGLFSPGPNVILLATSGARFGFAKTVPHIFGVAFGVGITSGTTGLGLGAFLSAFPAFKVVLQVISSFWIAYLAWRLWNSSPQESKGSSRPFTMVEAILFQWVNPKVWAVSIAAMAYVPDTDPIRLAVVLGCTFSTTNLFVCTFWTSAGNFLASLIRQPPNMMIFLRCMAICLAATVPLIFF